MPDQSRQLLLRQLCSYFRFGYDKVPFILAQQMLYIHDCVADDGMSIIKVIRELDVLQSKLRYRDRKARLNELYWELKVQTLAESGRYDMTSRKPPVKVWKNKDS